MLFGHEVSLMTMNVENLFDTKHDPGKNDYAYLPLELKDERIKRICKKSPPWAIKACLETDWSEQRLVEKLKRLSKAVTENGSPEILILQEVENKSVLERWRKNFLPAGYKYSVLLEGPDRRGIDVAFISQLPLYQESKPKLHNIKLNPPKDTRPILEATFLLPDKTPLTVFAIHFPSQHNPSKFRRQSIARLDELMNRLPRGRLAIAAGDSNVIKKEEYLWKSEAENWVSSTSLPLENGVGSHYYKGKWSLLDIFLLQPGMTNKNSGWVYKKGSHQVANRYSLQNRKSKRGLVPRAYRAPDYDGVSDHFPVKLTLKKIK